MFEDGREVGVGDGGVAARNQAQQGAGDMRERDLGKAGLGGEFPQPLFVGGVFPGMDEGDGDGGDALGAGGLQGLQGGGFVERFDLSAIDSDAAGDFGGALAERGGGFGFG